MFNERLHRALARRRPLAVLFLDLDRFKDVNDRLGHAAGDLLLQAVGARLRGCVRRTDTVARWAGDEFSVLLTSVANRADAERIAGKILGVLRRPFKLNGRRARTFASIGGCMLEGKTDPQRLIRKADRAMYAVKEQGGDGVQFWTRAVSLQRTFAQGNDSGENPTLQNSPSQREGAAKAAQSHRKAPQARTVRGP
jgi:diguanylate cyclase (GGDEF)-like protein